MARRSEEPFDAALRRTFRRHRIPSQALIVQGAIILGLLGMAMALFGVTWPPPFLVFVGAGLASVLFLVAWITWRPVALTKAAMRVFGPRLHAAGLPPSADLDAVVLGFDNGVTLGKTVSASGSHLTVRLFYLADGSPLSPERHEIVAWFEDRERMIPLTLPRSVDAARWARELDRIGPLWGARGVGCQVYSRSPGGAAPLPGPRYLVEILMVRGAWRGRPQTILGEIDPLAEGCARLIAEMLAPPTAS